MKTILVVIGLLISVSAQAITASEVLEVCKELQFVSATEKISTAVHMAIMLSSEPLTIEEVDKIKEMTIKAVLAEIEYDLDRAMNSSVGIYDVSENPFYSTCIKSWKKP